MLHLFYGENDYLIRKKIDELAKSFSETKKLDFTDQTREILELRSLSDVLSQQSLFAAKTLFVLRGFLKNASKKELDNLFAFLPEAKDVNIIFWEEKIDLRLKIVKWLLKNAEGQEFKMLRKPEVEKWITSLADSQIFSSGAVEELIRLHGSNLWALENEIKKLVAYTNGREITVEDVKKLCLPSAEENIFNFTDAVAVRNKNMAVKLFSNLLSQQQDPWYLFAMLVRQFRLLISMKSSGNLSKLHPFVVQTTRRQARYWELDELKKIYRQLFNIDVACKTGKGDLETELSLFLVVL